MTPNPLLDQARHAYAARRFPQALDLARRAAGPSGPSDAYVLWANAALQLQDHEAAVAPLAWLVEHHPHDPRLRERLATVHNNLGARAARGGDPTAALRHYDRALTLSPDHPLARLNRAELNLRLGQPAAALADVEQVLAQHPDEVDAALLRIEILLAAGDLEQAERAAQPLSTQVRGPEAERLLRLAARHGWVGLAAALIDALEASLTTSDRLALGDELMLNAAPELARRLWPVPAAGGAADLRLALAALQRLPPVYPSVARMHEERRAHAERLERLWTDFPPARLSGVALDDLATPPFWLAYQGENDCAPASRYGDWLAAAAARIHPRPAPRPPPRARPRLGLVSAFWRECTVGSYFAAWVEALTGPFEVVLVSLGPKYDAWTQALEARADGALRPTGAIAELARAIAALECDLLLYPELGMDGRSFVLAALRLAPIQVCAWGHPVTSGLPTIDAYLSCAEMEPADGASHYRERLLPLPGLGTRYRTPARPLAVSRAELGLPETGPLLLVPHAPFKWHPALDGPLAELLAAHPAAWAIGFAGERPGMTAALGARVRSAFAAVGVAPARFLQLPLVARERYLQIVAHAAVMLDPPNWSGGNTSLDALWMDVPIVTWTGRTMRARQSLAMLRRVGLTELIAATPAAFTQAASSVLADAAGPRRYARSIAAARDAYLAEDGALAALIERLRALLSY